MSLLALFTAAVAFWGQGNLPACGQPQLQVQKMSAYDGLAYRDTCRVIISSSAADLYFSPRQYRCAVVFHEVGHLYGMNHSERGVMAAPITMAPPICWRIYPLSSVRILAHTAKEQN